MKQVNILEAKTDFSKLIRMLETKKEDSITVARNGKPVAKIVLINETPLIFRKDIYATACIIGGIVFHICDGLGIGHEITAVVVSMVVISVRLLSVRYHIQLPVLHLSKTDNKNDTSL